jgi:peptidoglycan/LPS O-acetylase OafA/YrhL
LDGLRGLAVAGVVCFHGGWEWAAGGWLGVSLFFTLSGFLITSLLLSEARSHGTIDLRAFWGRRFRRLLPAAWVCIAVLLALTWWLADARLAQRSRWDALAALGQFSNWRFLLTGRSYGDLFRAPSPFLHFWSLAIEEQFYLLYPLLVAGICRLRRPRTTLAVGATVVAVGMWLVPVLFDFGVDRVYLGSDTRIGELLAGAVLAVVISNDRVRLRLARRRSWRGAAVVGGVIAAAGCVWLWSRANQSSSWVTHGLLPLQTVLSVALIVAAVVPTGPIRKLCALAPLRWLGKVSYAVYLLHWPLFVFLGTGHAELSKPVRFAITVPVTLVGAAISDRWLETPIRQGAGILRTGLRPAFAAPFLALAIVTGSLTLSGNGRSQGSFDPEEAQRRLTELIRERRNQPTMSPTNAPATTAVSDPATDATPAPTSTIVTPPALPVPLRLSMFGDSVALSLGLLLGYDKNIEQQTGSMEMGCGIARVAMRRDQSDQVVENRCRRWATTWPAVVATEHPHIAMIHSCKWDSPDQKIKRSDPNWVAVGDPGYDAFALQEFVAAIDAAAAPGELVAWVNCPDYGHAMADTFNAAQRRSHSPERVARLNQLIAQAVAMRSDRAVMLDLHGFMTSRVEDRSVREDGAHFNWIETNPVLVDFLRPELARIWADFATRHPPPAGG